MPDVTEWAKFRYDLTIEQPQVDAIGHMNNVAYVQIFEDARWQFITDSGFGFEMIKARKQGPIVLKIEINFRKEVLLGQRVYVESQVISHSGRLGRLRQDLKDVDDDTIYCKAIFTLGLFDMKLRKLILPSTDWIQACGGKINK